jgi:hypothetical protein
MVLDAATAELFDAFSGRRLHPLLLKGPATSRWLYPRDQQRRYIDIDLLVAPAEFDAVIEVVVSLGFERLLPERWLGVGSGELSEHAVVFMREGRRAASLDLHRRFFWSTVEPERAWALLSADPDQVEVGGVEVDVLRLAARALMLPLHVAQHGREDRQPLADLERALAAVEDPTWGEAAELARELGASSAFAAGLRVLPSGSELAERLGLASGASAQVRLQLEGNALIALAIEQFLTKPTWPARLRFAWAKLLPSPAYVLAGYPARRPGVLGVLEAYGRRVAHLGRSAPRALAALREARRAQHKQP